MHKWLWLICLDVWQRLPQHCKAIILQLKTKHRIWEISEDEGNLKRGEGVSRNIINAEIQHGLFISWPKF